MNTADTRRAASLALTVFVALGLLTVAPASAQMPLAPWQIEQQLTIERERHARTLQEIAALQLQEQQRHQLVLQELARVQQVLAGFIPGFSPLDPTRLDAGERVGLCHRTGSDNHPFVFIEIDGDAVDAHTRHGDQLALTRAQCDTLAVTLATLPGLVPGANRDPGGDDDGRGRGRARGHGDDNPGGGNRGGHGRGR
jgi:hypothetical protein